MKRIINILFSFLSFVLFILGFGSFISFSQNGGSIPDVIFSVTFTIIGFVGLLYEVYRLNQK